MPGQRVVDGIHRFHNGVVNWYLVEDDGRVGAVDAGFPTDWQQLESGLRTLGRGVGDLEAVVLTHAHIDHIGFAERARVEAGATVYVHEAEEELIRHPLRAAKSERNPLTYLRQPATRRLFGAALRSGAFRAKVIRDHTAFRDGETLEAVPGRPRVVFTPGHTFGHSAFHLPERDVVFSGDALVTRNPYTGRTGPQIVARAATADSEQALRSLDRLAETGAGTLLPGHGEPWTDGAEAAVARAREAGPS